MQQTDQPTDQPTDRPTTRLLELLGEAKKNIYLRNLFKTLLGVIVLKSLSKVYSQPSTLLCCKLPHQFKLCLMSQFAWGFYANVLPRFAKTNEAGIHIFMKTRWVSPLITYTEPTSFTTFLFIFFIFTNSAALGRVGHRVAKSVCQDVCLFVCAIGCSFFSPLIGPEITWLVPGLSLVFPPYLPRKLGNSETR